MKSIKIALIYSLLLVISSNLLAQEKETPYALLFVGANAYNVSENTFEYYSQYRSVFITRKISDRLSFGTGLTAIRIGDEMLVETPVFIRFQASKKLSLFAGIQENNTSSSAPASMMFRVHYQHTENWDSSIDIIQPFSGGDTSRFDVAPQPVRLRTGLKF